jgi:hypothetical protein
VQLAQSAKVFNLVGTATIKNQSELETVLPLNSWAPTTMKNQSEQDALLLYEKINLLSVSVCRCLSVSVRV